MMDSGAALHSAGSRRDSSKDSKCSGLVIFCAVVDGTFQALVLALVCALVLATARMVFGHGRSLLVAIGCIIMRACRAPTKIFRWVMRFVSHVSAVTGSTKNWTKLGIEKFIKKIKRNRKIHQRK